MQPTVKAIPNGMHTITSHIIVRDAGRAVEWYKVRRGRSRRGDGVRWKVALVARVGAEWTSAQPALHVTAGNSDTERLIEVFGALGKFLGGEKATLR